VKKTVKPAVEKHHFHVQLQPIQKLTIVAAMALILAIAAITFYSERVSLSIFGMFCQLLGVIILGLGLVKTNDELVDLTEHYQKLDRPTLIKHLAKDRFFIVLGVFTIALGMLLQIVGLQVLG
jgi:hypothetical protein